MTVGTVVRVDEKTRERLRLMSTVLGKSQKSIVDELVLNKYLNLVDSLNVTEHVPYLRERQEDYSVGESE